MLATDMANLSKSLKAYQKEIITLLSATEVIERSQEILLDLFPESHPVVYYWSDDRGRFLPVREEDAKEGLYFFVYDEFILWLGECENLIFKEDLDDLTGSYNLLESARNFLQTTSADVIVPFNLHNSLLAFLTVRHFARDTKTNRGQRVILSEIRNITTVALSNAALYERLESMNQVLEDRITERTKELKETQSQLVQNEKLASLGIMVAGIAHEINTPAGVINGAISNLTGSLSSFINLLSEKDILSIFQSETFSIIRQITESQNLTPLSATEKFKLKKELSVKYPDKKERIDFIIDMRLDTNTQLIFALPQTAFETLKKFASIRQNIKNIEYSIGAIVKIVRALKYYSHLDQAETEQADIAEGIENTLIILHNQLKHGITVEKNFSPLPKISCVVSELNQIWTNLIVNAVQAMQGKGSLKIDVGQKSFKSMPEAGTVLEEFRIASFEGKTYGAIFVAIEDSGPGISEKIQSRVFDPFFTTKKPGEGTGLGLGIVRNIVSGHGGFITLYSKPGCTRFTIYLPVHNDEK
ncbi:MAG: histidine kinase [Leptospiraceae bacterium]|nr:histidine kinase [Leptospiraceae bacterium]